MLRLVFVLLNEEHGFRWECVNYMFITIPLSSVGDRYASVALVRLFSFLPAEVFVLHHNYTCIYTEYSLMECAASSEIVPIHFHAPVLVEPIGTSFWWIMVGLSAAAVLISGLSICVNLNIF